MRSAARRRILRSSRAYRASEGSGPGASRPDRAAGTGRRPGQGPGSRRPRWMRRRPPWPPPSSTWDRHRLTTSACRRCTTTPTVVGAHLRRCGLALCRHRRADPGRHQLQQPGPAHRSPLAEFAAAPAHSGARRRHSLSCMTATNCRCAWMPSIARSPERSCALRAM